MLTFSSSKTDIAGIDKEHVQKIINENTSPDFEGHSKKKKERIDARIKRYNDIMAKFTPHQILQAQTEMDDLVAVLEKERDLSHYVVHVDMDAFYAAVEMRDDPSLRNIPMAVGSNSMLSTANYAARRFGICSAMPGFIAKKLCPQLKIVHGNPDKYREASSVARKIFSEYDPDFTMAGLDEAYIDLTAYIQNRFRTGSAEYERIRYMGECVCRLPLVAENEMSDLVDAEITEEMCTKCKKLRKCVRDRITFGVDVDEIVREMRFRVEQAVGLTCSAGIAPNSLLAKVCSDINKPNGQYRLMNEREAILTFLKDLPIRKINGIGPVTEAVLKGIGLEKCGDLYERRGIISLLFPQSNYEYFLRIALGISYVFSADRRSKRKSISTERTFHPTGDLKILLETLESLCNELIDSLLDHRIRGGRAVTVKMKFSTFDVITRCCSVDYLIFDADRLFALCSKFLRREMHSGRYLRLLGVRLARLVFEDEKAYFQNFAFIIVMWIAEMSNPLCSFWERRKKELTAMEYINDASNDSLLFPALKFDNNFNNADGLDDVLQEVVHVDELQPCPICKVALPRELDLVNQHIDECLNRQAINELQDAQKTNKATVKRENSKDKMLKKRPVKTKVPNKISKNSLENYFIRRPMNM
uniref:DNA polymerase kappa n=1 Tax=Onchocerca volvulus TaxID=6282 RepID=A0A8R1TSM8_ONCVO